MCGIFGYYDLRRNALKSSVISEMGAVIRHRGPDGMGIFHDVDRAVALGNQRLAILDVEHGGQPFYSEDKSIVVVQNGEIFNYVEIAQELARSGYPCVTGCDTEVILRVYEKYGVCGIEKFNGMFAIAIFDYRINRLYLFRDRAGEKPLHYSFDDGRFLFGSEIKSLLKAMPSHSVDYQALDQFLAFNYVPPPRTMYKGIKHVMPGHYLEVDAGGVREKCWWDLSKIEIQDKTQDEWIKEFNATLDDAVRLRLRSDVPLGAFLSGGVDSSSVVGVMAKHLSSPVKTYCIGFDDPRYDESPYAQEAAERFGTDHHLNVVAPNMLSLWPMATYHCDQPHGDVSFMPTYRVSKMAAQDVKMVLTGDGADELFAGYDKYKNFFASSDNMLSSSTEFQNNYADNISLFTASERSRLFASSLQSQLECSNTLLDVLQPVYDASAHMDRINQVLYIDTVLLLPGNNLVKPDRMGMAASIENRAPFLDYRMIELAFSMPGELKLHNGETKYIYKKAVTSLIGEHLAYRKKQMFTVPVGEWFKTELKAQCENLLLSERVRARQLFNYDYVAQIFKEHCEGLSNYTRQLRALMALEYWYRCFEDE
ncbi:asparagine synthase (glutamine-hydrolyzing) [Halodesulfovibrio marinisediminis]|uniref:asparagine synthase (glutamine-hydrolyzing) n=1 Tax=Halodesulfovibrio marinisediminis DSM 17456 TaxID=1121457 RepID=A0A1N6FT42_9BACT|nr:asparagine synthase (glutamine-hydrolyzing) [Halodesulfovibrio marinisediminis]SIN98361.1 asparagine synthase (glutamine-hydrolysing) [Halodesulfovibrio marinisediminis DSM 17456]